MLAIIGASGKIGGATLDALLSYDLFPRESIVACTSAAPHSATWQKLAAKRVTVRHASFDDGGSIEQALHGCDKLYLVSSPRIAMDYPDAGPGTGREKDHVIAIQAAQRAEVKHIYYTSLAFANPSKASVMRAHIRTEAHLASLRDMSVTVMREGLYNESWPLYLGFFYDFKNDSRGEIPLSGDGKICWTGISDLGLASALVVSAPSAKYAGKTFYLSNPPQTAMTVAEVAAIVSKALDRTVHSKIVSREHYEKFYIDECKADQGHVKWWASTYEALKDNECLIDDPTFTELLKSKGRRPTSMEETVQRMIQSST